MVQREAGVLSPAGDALLLAALFAPFAPIGATINFYLIGLAFGCPADTALSCEAAWFDFNHLFARSADMLEKTASAMRDSNVLLAYLLLMAGLAQITVTGFRGRVVRSCAVIMWGSVMPLVLALASAITRSPEKFCGGGECSASALLFSFGFYGTVFINWLADIAVPLGVMVSGLLAMTLGYAAMIKWVVLRVTRRG